MIIYGPSLSPFTRKLLAAAAEKGLDAEHRPVGPHADDPEFQAASPFGKVPAFRDGDFGISDSSAIIAYLEATHPEPALIPGDPRQRALTIWYDEFADTILMPVVTKMFLNRILLPKMMGRPGDLAEADKAEREEAPRILSYLEGVIPQSGHLVGDRLTLADLAVASPFVNAEHAGFVVDAASYPKTAAYLAAVHARPSFAGHIAAEKAMLAG